MRFRQLHFFENVDLNLSVPQSPVKWGYKSLPPALCLACKLLVSQAVHEFLVK